MDLTGKNIVYVGGFGGIGFASCKELLTRDIKSLIILDLQQCEEKLKALKNLRPTTAVEFIALNLLDGKTAIESALRAVKAKFTHIDVLINGSGLVNDRNPKLCVDVNLLGLIETTLATVPLMSKGEDGRGGLIVNIASVFGLQPGSFAAVYTATKHGVVGFTRACADEHYFNHTGISHIVFCPGATKTKLIENFVALDTFDFSKPLTEEAIKTKYQTAEECATSLVKAIETAGNGSVWISDLGKLRKVELPKYWEYSFD